jgi:hypothetical protein
MSTDKFKETLPRLSARLSAMASAAEASTTVEGSSTRRYSSEEAGVATHYDCLREAQVNSGHLTRRGLGSQWAEPTQSTGKKTCRPEGFRRQAGLAAKTEPL